MHSVPQNVTQEAVAATARSVVTVLNNSITAASEILTSDTQNSVAPINGTVTSGGVLNTAQSVMSTINNAVTTTSGVLTDTTRNLAGAFNSTASSILKTSNASTRSTSTASNQTTTISTSRVFICCTVAVLVILYLVCFICYRASVGRGRQHTSGRKWHTPRTRHIRVSRAEYSSRGASKLQPRVYCPYDDVLDSHENNGTEEQGGNQCGETPLTVLCESTASQYTKGSYTQP
ncbi:MAG: hypothetical protein ACTJLM_01705 [Ehrlichia sp.]